LQKTQNFAENSEFHGKMSASPAVSRL